MPSRSSTKYIPESGDRATNGAAIKRESSTPYSVLFPPKPPKSQEWKWRRARKLPAPSSSSTPNVEAFPTLPAEIARKRTDVIGPSY